ncbi:MAG: M48 family metalloprotease [Cocleimonas sp.]|nr:M48 family metalloprotease [Cocleimonas sp.]
MSYYRGLPRWFFVLFMLSFPLVLTSCSVNPVSGKKEFSLISKDQELSMGLQAHKGVVKKTPPYANKALQTYVNGIGQQLAKKSHRRNIYYTFTVLDDPTVNAFALPGGYIYITTGLMAYLNSEAELAGVLGHEIGHVTARHGVQQASAGMATSVLVGLIAKQSGVKPDLLGQFGSALLRGYGRDHELQADRLGSEYLAHVGYDPKSMMDVISVLKAQEEYDRYAARKEGRRPSAYHGVFSTHPSNDRRLQEVVGAAKHIATAGSRPANRNAYLNKINGLTFRVSKNKTGRIVVGKITKTGLSFDTLAQKSLLNGQKLRLLNGKFPKGEPEFGSLVKIVQ